MRHGRKSIYFFKFFENNFSRLIVIIFVFRVICMFTLCRIHREVNLFQVSFYLLLSIFVKSFFSLKTYTCNQTNLLKNFAFTYIFSSINHFVCEFGSAPRNFLREGLNLKFIPKRWGNHREKSARSMKKFF